MHGCCIFSSNITSKSFELWSQLFRPIICRNEVNFRDIQQNQPNWELTKQKIQISFFLKSLKVKTCQSSDKDNSLNSTPTIEQKRQIESTDKMISHPTATTWGSERVTCKDKILSATHVLKIAVNRNNLYNCVHIIYTYYRFWKMRDIIFYRFFVF